jgi:hypothetical protein
LIATAAKANPKDDACARHQVSWRRRVNAARVHAFVTQPQIPKIEQHCAVSISHQRELKTMQHPAVHAIMAAAEEGGGETAVAGAAVVPDSGHAPQPAPADGGVHAEAAVAVAQQDTIEPPGATPDSAVAAVPPTTTAPAAVAQQDTTQPPDATPDSAVAAVPPTTTEQSEPPPDPAMPPVTTEPTAAVPPTEQSEPPLDPGPPVEVILVDPSPDPPPFPPPGDVVLAEMPLQQAGDGDELRLLLVQETLRVQVSGVRACFPCLSTNKLIHAPHLSSTGRERARAVAV